MYYLQECEAAKGCKIDKTLIKFEIKKNGKVITCKMIKKIERAKLLNIGDTNELNFYGIKAILLRMLLLLLNSIKRK